MKFDVSDNRRAVVLCRFLLKVCASPSLYVDDLPLHKALASQHALSKLHRSSEGLTSSALNTLKRHSDDVDGLGWNTIDELRRSALEVVSRAKTEGRLPLDSKASLRIEVRRLNVELRGARSDLWQISRAFYRALKDARGYAINSQKPELVALCETNEKELRAMMNMARAKAIVNIE